MSLEEAILNGIAPDGGLYMPSSIPHLTANFFKKMAGASFADVSYAVGKEFFLPDLPENVLKEIIAEAFDFDVPLVELYENVFALELFHGPTLAFKDFAARFMARLFGFFASRMQKEITILVATSGDTGSAVAHGFLEVPGITVVILYPSGKVSPLQEKQLTGMGKNVSALEIQGTFDDCQTLVKKAFLDTDLRKTLDLSSANSINIARLIPQSFYYIYLCTMLPSDPPLAVSVPSGNFGNLTAGLIAKEMDAPISRFVASTNVNAAVVRYLDTGQFEPAASIATISNAMDVGNPSNFSRMKDIYEEDHIKMRRDIYGASFTDDETKQAIAEAYEEYGYILDPHGAVGYLGLRKFMRENEGYTGVFLETAHPAKFSETVEDILHAPVLLPPRLEVYAKKKKESFLLKNDFEEFKSFLLR